MNVNFSKKIIEELKNKIIDSDFWLCKYEGGECADVKEIEIADSTKELIEKEYGLIRSGNYCVLYDEGSNDDEGDKVFIFKDYIELTISRRNQELN